MTSPRQKQVDWINAILDQRGWTKTHLARMANLSASTLTKFMAADDEHTLSSNTLEKIRRASNFELYQSTPVTPQRGTSAQEAIEFDYEMVQDTAISNALRSAASACNQSQIWRLNSRALENAGYLPGDYLLVDASAEPKLGDTVCARLKQTEQTDPTTIIRIFESPFLVPATTDQSLLRPLLLDGQSVTIAGVVVASFRPRRAA
jgi:SOS-response transcriptional repressor LexA